MALPGESPPTIALRLTPHADNFLSFKLNIANVVLPASPTKCGITTRRLLLAGPPVPLNTQLRVLLADRKALTISLTPSFACRKDGLGALRTLALVQPGSGPKLGSALAIRAHGANQLRVGQTATITATVRNNTRATADGAAIAALIPPGFRVVAHSGRGSTDNGRVIWRFATLKRGQSRTVHVTIAAVEAFTGPRCAVVTALAILRHPAAAKICTAVTATIPPNSGRG